MSALTYLGIGINVLVGEIPHNIGYTLPNIQGLILQGNQFEGQICWTPPLGSPRVAHTSPWISYGYAWTPTEIDIIVIYRINTIIKYITEFITIEARRHNLTNPQNTAETHKNDLSPTGSLSADKTGFSNLHLLFQRSQPLYHMDPQIASMST